MQEILKHLSVNKYMPQKHISLGYRKKSAARLASVQVLYDMEITGITPMEALENFRHYAGRNLEVEPAVEPDGRLLSQLVIEASKNKSMIDEVITGSLTPDWKIQRLDKVLLSILRAGIGELYLFPSTDTGIIIAEYMDVSRAFYSEKEPGLINAILQNAARVLRGN